MGGVMLDQTCQAKAARKAAKEYVARKTAKEKRRSRIKMMMALTITYAIVIASMSIIAAELEGARPAPVMAASQMTKKQIESLNVFKPEFEKHRNANGHKN